MVDSSVLVVRSAGVHAGGGHIEVGSPPPSCPRSTTSPYPTPPGAYQPVYHTSSNSPALHSPCLNRNHITLDLSILFLCLLGLWLPVALLLSLRLSLNLLSLDWLCEGLWNTNLALDLLLLLTVRVSLLNIPANAETVWFL